MLGPETKANFFKVTSADPEGLRKPELRAIGFDFSPMADKVAEISGDLDNIESHENMLRMSPAAESALMNIAGNLFSQVIERIRTFVITDNPNASSQYREIGTALAGIYYEFVTVAEPFLVRIALGERTAYGVRAPGIVPVPPSDDLFSKQADVHAGRARFWFLAMAAAIAAFIYALPKLFAGQQPFEYFSGADASADMVQVLVFKSSVLLLIGFAIYQSAKNCRIHSHLDVANRHRHNALAAYQRIAAKTQDAEVRTLIASQAARAVFEPVATGHFSFRVEPRPAIAPEALGVLAAGKAARTRG